MASSDEDEVNDLSRGRSRSEREARVDSLRREREGRADNLEYERENRARDLAVRGALRDADVARRLNESTARLDRINGSIDRFNASLLQHDKRMEQIERAFGEWTAVARASQPKD